MHIPYWKHHQYSVWVALHKETGRLLSITRTLTFKGGLFQCNYSCTCFNIVKDIDIQYLSIMGTRTCNSQWSCTIWEHYKLGPTFRKYEIVCITLNKHIGILCLVPIILLCCSLYIIEYMLSCRPICSGLSSVV